MNTFTIGTTARLNFALAIRPAFPFFSPPQRCWRTRTEGGLHCQSVSYDIYHSLRLTVSGLAAPSDNFDAEPEDLLVPRYAPTVLAFQRYWFDGGADGKWHYEIPQQVTLMPAILDDAEQVKIVIEKLCLDVWKGQARHIRQEARPRAA